MRIEDVTLAAFGAFQDRLLDFAPGLNVVWGPNESGKSTVHSALIAAICGVPEPGQRRPEDRAFADRHRPWQPSLNGSNRPRWHVKATLQLAEGPHVMIERDLDHPQEDKEVRDAKTNSDLGKDLAWEGSPDCSRWLGLNRRTFGITAATAQAAVLRIAVEPSLLQDDLKRAAAGAGQDIGLARAFQLLGADLDEELDASLQDLKDLDDQLRKTVEARDHQVFLQLHSEEAAENAIATARLLRACEGAIAKLRVDQLEARLARIAELKKQYPVRPGPEDPPTGEEEQVRAALLGWEARPEIPELQGATAEELKAKLEAIQDQDVEGDTVPDPAVLAAREVYEFSNAELDRHWAARPADVEPPDTALTPEELRDLARQVEDAGPEPQTSGVPRLLRRRDDAAPKHPVARARALGLDPDPEALRKTADLAEAAAKLQEESKRWSARQKRLRQESVNAESRLRSALGSRGVQAPAGQIMQAVFQYVRDCEERARVAARAAEREQVQELLRARELLEERRSEAAAANERAVTGVRAAARAIKLRSQEPPELAPQLRGWLDKVERERTERERAREAWQELTGLLEGRTEEQFATELQRRWRRANSIRREVGDEAIDTFELVDDGGEQLATLRRESEDAAREAAESLARFEAGGWVPHPAEAEEARGEADRRVWELNHFRDALAIARERLAAAGQAMNVDIAPAVAAVLKRWLPRISDGRYTEAWVDPLSLQVDVRTREGDWQPAGLLSHATAELIYLLLRMAIVEHLTPEGRSCPLLLDDVTVQSDSARTEALMEILHEVSADHQVILFTREERILEWAERHLDGDRDRVQRLA